MVDKKVMIFSAPSGAGKSTIVNHLISRFSWLGFSISATSRPPRGEERDGKEYYFLTKEEFISKIEEGSFVEYEEVYPGRFYGTLRSEVDKVWQEGKVVLFDIDVKGGVNLKKLYGNNALATFIMPPSLEILRERLQKRGTDTPQAIETRLSKAQEEIGYSGEFDTIIINDSLARSLAQAERLALEFYNKEI